MTAATGDQLDAAASTVEPSPALASSTRTRAARVDTYCAHCGRRMSPGRHGRRRYCSNSCRQGAYKRRRRSAVELAGKG